MRTRTFRFAFPAAMLALFVAAGAAAQEGSAPLPADGATEGIAVHGHWTISVVRDGEVVERREFENALVSEGATHLSVLLAGNTTAGNWMILVSAPGTGALCVGETLDGFCQILEDDAEVTVSTADDGSGGLQLVLEGSDTAARDGDITRVATLQATCASDTAAAACTFEGSRENFTATDLDPTIAVQNGDRIDVTVEISFN
jgi:ketosteroid isomerase-like protein